MKHWQAMVFNHKRQFVYVSLPRTASRSITTKLLEDEDTFSGTLYIPESMRPYFTWTVVRHPYTRLYSYWAGGLAPRFRSFDSFCEASFPEVYSQVQLTRHMRLDHVGRFENLAEAIPRAFRNGDLPHIHDGQTEHPELSSSQKRAICRVFREDFKAFDYAS